MAGEQNTSPLLAGELCKKSADPSVMDCLQLLIAAKANVNVRNVGHKGWAGGEGLWGFMGERF